MPHKKSRVVIDTNIWICFLLSKDFEAFDKIVSTPNLVLLYSKELLDELVEVAQRPKFKKYFTVKDLEELLIQMKKHSEFIEVRITTNICRDSKDNFLLSLSKEGKATHLITGDKDLLVLKRIGKTRIVTLNHYLTQI